MAIIDHAAGTAGQLLSPEEAAARLALPPHALRELADRALLVPAIEDAGAGYRREDVERLARARDAGDAAARTHEEANRALTNEVAALRAENAALRRQLAAGRAGHPGRACAEIGLLPALRRGAIASYATARRTLARVGPMELACFVGVLLFGLALRTINLGALPSGLHGDEGVTGLATGQILREGPIGPYTGLANGMPTGTFYLTTIPVLLFGHTIFAVRILSAVAGMLTLAALYVLMRRPFGAPAALIGTTLLATMDWHLHFSRIGFPVIAWPLCTLATTWLLTEALRRGDWRWWAGTGACAGVGLYLYNAHLLFIGLLGLFLLGYVAWDTYRARRHPMAARLLLPAALAAGLIIVASPMIAFALKPGGDYFSHSDQVSIFSKPEWIAREAAGNGPRYLAGRYLSYWDQVCCHPVPDGADGTGVVPLAPPGLLLLGLVGAGLALARRRSPLVIFGLLTLLLLPLASVVTVNGLGRRTLPVAPLLALFAALPLAALLDLARQHWRASGGRAWYAPMAGLAVAAIVLTSGAVNLDNYFRRFADSHENRWVFASEITEAATFINTLPAGSYVYFYSERWGYGYETRLYLAPDYAGEDRSAEYGKRTDYDIDDDRADAPAAFILLGSYRDRLGEVRDQYPDGKVTIGGTRDRPTFSAVVVLPDQLGR